MTADYERLIKEWDAVKSFWNREDNISLSKHCEEKGVDYKRCITHNQPMRKLTNATERNKYADDQLTKFRAKLTPRNAQGAPQRRASVASDASHHSAPAPARNDEELERLRTEKNDLADRVAELTARIRRMEAAAPPAEDVWEGRYKRLVEENNKQLNWWKRLATRQSKQITILKTYAENETLSLPECPDGQSWIEREYPEDELKEGWWERRKAALNKPKAPIRVVAVAAEEEKEEE